MYHFLIYFAGSSVVPPCFLQCFSDFISTPLPLQAFLPLQALAFVLHELLPLQELTP